MRFGRGGKARWQRQSNTFAISSTCQQKISLCVHCVLWLIVFYDVIIYAIPLTHKGIAFSTSTEENCKIMNYTQSNCRYSCDCIQLIGDYTPVCISCHGTQYIHKVTAESKCGNRMLIETKDPQSCPGKEPYELNKIIKCYVPFCDFETFTYHRQYYHMVGAVFLLAICVPMLISIPLFKSWKQKDNPIMNGVLGCVVFTGITEMCYFIMIYERDTTAN
eukprot:302927_1